MIMRMLFRTLLCFFLLALNSVSTRAQVRITVPPGPYKPHEQIVATVANSGRNSIIVCIETGQTSQIGEDRQSTPYPFLVQRFAQDRWNTLLIGPDIGSFRATDVLRAGESMEFPFALNDAGKVRLVLQYWPEGPSTKKCPSKGAKTVKSNPFIVRE